MYRRLEYAIVLFSLLYAAGCEAVSVHFPRFSHTHRGNALLHNKRSGGNPCVADKPFLCKSTPTCIALSSVCDGLYDCDDGFDEMEAVCNAANRPPVEEIWQFLETEQDWIIPKLFDGIDPEFVAHSLAVSPDLKDLQLVMGLSDTAVENIKKTITATKDGDERPLLAIGMPENSWHETEFIFNKLIESGFKV